MNYSLRHKQEKFNENMMSCHNTKLEVEKAIVESNTYTNVDNAKKRAVHQGMDYDNFHQMVLGANLKPIPKNEVLNQLQKGQKPWNSSAINSNEAIYSGFGSSEIEETKLGKDEEIPNNQAQFSKNFIYRIHEGYEKQEYLKLVFDKFDKIFEGFMEIELILRIFSHFKSYVLDNPQLKDWINEVIFSQKFVNKMINHPSYSNTVKFFCAKDKLEINGIIKALEENSLSKTNT